jgi:hypothetical protein
MQLVFTAASEEGISSSWECPGGIQFKGWRINKCWKPIKAVQTSVLFQMFIFFYVLPASYDVEMVIMPVKSSAFLLILVKILQGRLGYGSLWECTIAFMVTDTHSWDGGYV